MNNQYPYFIRNRQMCTFNRKALYFALALLTCSYNPWMQANPWGRVARRAGMQAAKQTRKQANRQVHEHANKGAEIGMIVGLFAGMPLGATIGQDVMRRTHGSIGNAPWGEYMLVCSGSMVSMGVFVGAVGYIGGCAAGAAAGLAARRAVLQAARAQKVARLAQSAKK